MERYTLGLSSCPNDTFIFHALLHGLVPVPFQVEPYMADVEELNACVLAGQLPFSKISLGCVPFCQKDYALLCAGAALGFGNGPLVVAKKEPDEELFAKGTLAIPGTKTTANLLVHLTKRFQGECIPMLFSDIIPAVCRGDVDFGVIIHEGRFTYKEHGLNLVLDLGAWWEEHFAVPLPLGAICVRRDIPKAHAKAMEEAIAHSLAYAWEHPAVSRPYIQSHAQELADTVISAHIKTFVTSFSQNLGDVGKGAIEALVAAGKSLHGIEERAPLFLD
ncbi:MAG: 1,4-dihydroxy-6-naphthoate synthase [Desulfovibrio sp.]|nr:1,4-dihydroxy-6-naphthoate synthase [Desulfovibrio sp.]